MNFIRTHLIYRYGIPCYIMTDNGKHFYNSLVDQLCEKFGFKQHKYSMYNAPANGLAEAFNKTFCNLLEKSGGTLEKRLARENWRSVMGVSDNIQNTHTSYSIFVGVRRRSSFSFRATNSLSSNCYTRRAYKWGERRLRLKELEALDEKRLEAQQHLESYQAWLSRAFNKKVKPRSFQQGDLVLAVRRPINTLHKIRNEFTSKWKGLYVV